MRAPLLLLFLIFYCDVSNGIELNDCEDEAMCYVHTSCALKVNKPDEMEHLKSNGNECEIGFKIKPFKTHEKISWTISMSNGKDASKSLIWKLYGEKILSCDGKTSKLVEILDTDFGNQFLITDPKMEKDGKTCTFTISTIKSSETIADILDLRSKNRILKTRIVGDSGEYYTTFVHQLVNEYVKCDPDLLNEICHDSEHCDMRESKKPWKCHTGYKSMFRKDENSNFTEAADITCFSGEWSFSTKEVDKFSAGSQSKCAVKKCSLCEAKDNFKSLLQNQTDPLDNCKTLMCPDGFMVINNEITTAGPVECRDEVAPPKTDNENNKLPKRNKWIVNNKSVEIETAVCKTVTCNDFNKIIPVKCKNDDKSCAEPSVHNLTTGMYECKAGYTLNMVNKSGSLEPIGQPKCDNSSKTIQWIVPVHREKIENIAVNNNLTVTCIQNKVAEAKSGKDEPSNGMMVVYILVPILIIIIIIIAVAFGILCCLKRRRNKPKGAPVPSKTSSSSNTSSKPSSTEQEKEKEPLTSAMVSITAESAHTGVGQIPAPKNVVLANADLRGTTAAASDPSSKKDEKEKKEEEQVLLIPDKKVEEVKKKEPAAAAQNSDDDDKKEGPSSKEQLAPFPSAGEDGLKSQTGGDGESQVSTKKNAESAKLLPKGGRGPPRKYSKTSTKASSKKPSNKAFLNVTDDSDPDEPSRTGSKRRPKKIK